MVTYVFPGQGSQRRGMGGALFEDFNDLTAKVDDILGYSIKELCLDDPLGQLNQTQYTQPALYVVNVFSYLKKIEEVGKKPDYAAGHSLGEYNALFAADVFDFETGLRLVQRRGELMAQAKGGGMAAVIGLSEEKIQRILDENGLNTLVIANYNSPSQIVISGKREDIERAESIFTANGAPLYVPLRVSGAFHTRYMEDAQKQFKSFLDEFEVSEPTLEVVSNVYARPYDPKRIKETLAEQITNSVKWTESIRYLMGKRDMEFEEVGPGNVLTKLIKKIKNETKPL